MRDKSRKKKAFLISALAHIAALLCWGWFAASPAEDLSSEEIVRVELIEDVPPNFTDRQVAEAAPTQRQSAETAAVSVRQGEAARRETRKITTGIAGNGASQVDVSGVSGALGDGLADDRAGQGGVGNEAASTPAPGSMGYSRAEPIAKVKPVYPAQEAKSGISGTCHVRVEVLADGSTGACEIARRSGSAALDQAALSAARQYRFAPARDLATGEAVNSSVVLPVRFDPPEEEEDLW